MSRTSAERSSRFDRVAIIVLLGALLHGSVASAQTRGPGEEPLALIMDQAPLDEVVRAIADRTGVDYLFAPPLPGRITIAVPSRVSAAEATEILHAALLIKGFVALPIAPARFKIVRWEKMAGSAPFTEAPLSPEDEHSVTTRIVLRYASPETVARTLRPLVQASGQIIPFAPARSLIFAGTANRVHRLIDLARQLDSAEHETLIVRRLRYRDASEVKTELDGLLSRNKRGSRLPSKVEIILDARTNALVLSGPSADLDQLREWISVIDIPQTGSGELHVVKLIHQDPAAIEALLNAQRGRGPAGAGGNELVIADSGPLMGQNYTVVSHPSTRSLVIRSDRETFDVLSRLIAELDREPRMVRVAARIFEISTNGQLAVGVGGVIPIIEPKKITDTALIALVNPVVSPAAIPDLDLPGLNLPGTGGGVFGTPLLQISGEDVIIPVFDSSGQPTLDPDGTPQVIVVPGLGISLIASDVQADITLVQEPHLTIAVGEESEIFVGDNVPIPVGSTDNPTSGIGPAIRIDIQRVDVGTLLRMKPLLSNEGDLQIELQIENRLVTGFLPETGPVIAERSIDTSFSAGFGKRMVIAGLNSETDQMIEIRTPFLSDIPILGQLFRAKLRVTRRTYFIVTIEAHLIPTMEEKQATNESLVRAISRVNLEIAADPNARYALRAASYYKRETAEAALAELDVKPWPTVISLRTTDEGERFDLFVTGFPDITDMARIALNLEAAGLAPEIVTLAGGRAAVR